MRSRLMTAAELLAVRTACDEIAARDSHDLIERRWRLRGLALLAHAGAQQEAIGIARDVLERIARGDAHSSIRMAREALTEMDALAGKAGALS